MVRHIPDEIAAFRRRGAVHVVLSIAAPWRLVLSKHIFDEFGHLRILAHGLLRESLNLCHPPRFSHGVAEPTGPIGPFSVPTHDSWLHGVLLGGGGCHATYGSKWHARWKLLICYVVCHFRLRQPGYNRVRLWRICATGRSWLCMGNMRRVDGKGTALLFLRVAPLAD
jgi:hypothetical protein